jgi:hypothetical protein
LTSRNSSQRWVQSPSLQAYSYIINSERIHIKQGEVNLMKTIQKAMLVGVLAASLALGVIAAFADGSSKDNGADQPTTQLTRKVNEYEGQH